MDKCTLRFSSNVPQDLVDSWFKKYRQVWPAPNGGFKDANITVFWDIEVWPGLGVIRVHARLLTPGIGAGFSIRVCPVDASILIY